MARMPVLFIGHGSPMNAIETNRWTTGWQKLALDLPKPRAILAISAHWYVPGTFLMANPHPETIHDFGGFPQQLFDIRYPARGDGALVDRVVKLLDHVPAQPKLDWGLDHGTWSVLVHLRPAADIPVVQLSIDRRLSPTEHVAIGRALQPLRDEGILILASGNFTHNLGHAIHNQGMAEPDWASSFDSDTATALQQGDNDYLARAIPTERGRMAHPSPDHYFPLLYAAGARAEGDAVSFPVTGFDLGSLSMRSARIG